MSVHKYSYIIQRVFTNIIYIRYKSEILNNDTIIPVNRYTSTTSLVPISNIKYQLILLQPHKILIIYNNYLHSV